MSLIACPRCGARNRVPPDRAHLRARCGKCRTPLDAAPDGRPVDVSDASFEAEVLRATIPVLVDCWAPWCAPCRALAPVLDEIAREYAGRVRVAKLNVDENPAVAGRFAIQGIPTLLLFTGGQLRDRLVGVQPKPAIRARLEAALQAA
jgi:thioredoxin 2